jgi:hypothetical protein
MYDIFDVFHVCDVFDFFDVFDVCSEHAHAVVATFDDGQVYVV